MNISKSMLNMSCVILAVTGRDANRNPTYGDPLFLNNVYISYDMGETDGTNGKQAADTMTLYYDCQNSDPYDFVFEKGQKVVFNNAEFSVYRVKPCYGSKGLEHYEIELK